MVSPYYPNQVPWTDKKDWVSPENPGDLVEADHVNQLYAEVNAIGQDVGAHKSDYADLKTDYEKEATKFTIESDDTYDRETRPTVYYKKNGWVKLIYSVLRIDGELMLRNEYLLRLPVGFRPKTHFVTLAVQSDLGIVPPFEKITLRVYNTGELQLAENATKEIIHGEVVFYAGGGTV